MGNLCMGNLINTRKDSLPSFGDRIHHLQYSQTSFIHIDKVEIGFELVPWYLIRRIL